MANFFGSFVRAHPKGLSSISWCYPTVSICVSVDDTDYILTALKLYETGKGFPENTSENIAK